MGSGAGAGAGVGAGVGARLGRARPGQARPNRTQPATEGGAGRPLSKGGRGVRGDPIFCTVPNSVKYKNP